jgi:mono/diheme cytochrome c family protein
MSMFRLLLVVGCAMTASAQAGTYGLGKPSTEAAISAWNIDVTPDGAGLPAGSGSTAQGQQVYEAKCAICHGAKGEGKPADVLVGGIGTLKDDRPVKTLGSFWPYAAPIYSYIHRAMPYPEPKSLRPDEVYAVTAYLLFLNGIVPKGTVLDAKSLPKIQMPNRNGFISDVRPDVVNTPCLNCR